MKFKKITLALIVMFGSLSSYAQAIPKQYDFSYNVSGDGDVSPDQVFDDGVNTFLQFPDSAKIPAIFVANGKGEQLVKFKVDGPYVVVLGVAKKLTTQRGSQKALIEYLDPKAAKKNDKLNAKSIKPTFRKDERIQEAVLDSVAFTAPTTAKLAAEPAVTTVVTEAVKANAAPANSSPATALTTKTEVIKLGVPAAAPAAPLATPVAAPVIAITPIERSTPWVVKSGSFLREVLMQWGVKAGWSIVWNMSEKEDFRFDSGTSFGGDFKDAVQLLFNALPPHIQIYAELRPDNSPPLLYVTREQGAR